MTTKHITREDLDGFEDQLNDWSQVQDGWKPKYIIITPSLARNLIYTARAYYAHRMDELAVTGQELEEDMKDD